MPIMPMLYTVVYRDSQSAVYCNHMHRTLKSAVACIRRNNTVNLPCDIFRVELRPLTPKEKSEVLTL